MLNDAARLAGLQAVGLLGVNDAPAVLERAARLAARALHAPIAQVNLITDSGQVPIAAFVEPPEDASPWRRPVSLDYSFCQHAVTSGAPVLIEDARAHPLTRDSPVTRDVGVVGYLSVPIRLRTADASPGPVLGTVCVVDRQ
ncbi:MAG: hypothetical protein AVDCRST_MAG40-2550, partial [uncultured Gemmatimonadaceae bacterium]